MAETYAGKTVFVGVTPWPKDASAPLGTSANPIQSIAEALKGKAAGIILFSTTNFDDWVVTVGGGNGC